jgi:hypothetical protein
MELLITDTKCCNRCKVEKTLDNFTVTNNNRCRDCKREVKHIYAKNNPERHKELYTKDNALSRVKNAENIKAYLNKPEVKQKNYKKNREWLKNNKERAKKWQVEYRIANAEKINKYQRDLRVINKERNIIRDKLYKEKNAHKFKEHQIKRYIKVQNTPILKMRQRVTSQINKALKRFGYGKNSHTRVLLGVDFDIFKIHIERQFKKGMTWDNNGSGEGKWHLDHIMPLASAKTEKELLGLFHYTNLRPLWSKENILKGAKIIEHQLKMVI